MKHEAKADGELEFTKEVSVQEGKQYQYKFRVGDGEWWVLNEQAPIGRCFSIRRTRVTWIVAIGELLPPLRYITPC
jgi:hypothetical protein